MKPVTFDIVAMQYLQLFERFAGAPAKDCIAQENKHLDTVQEQLLFVVDERDIGKAIGRQGANVKKLEQAFRKKVRIVAFSDDPCTFIQNLIAADVVVPNFRTDRAKALIGIYRYIAYFST